MSYNNELSSLSYTNKDFNSIYAELLEYAKKISYKWDPTASDESDPGLVLLKLVSLIGDKNNYNIDKNVLELMPVSVTQIPTARQLFDQCGYCMHHYEAAYGSLNVELKVHPEVRGENQADSADSAYTYTLPRFTMFTDTDSSVVYTSIDESSLKRNETRVVNVLEGRATTYSINNDTNITLTNLDSNNRLYFTDYDVAENGIFITNTGENNYEKWQKVDNLYVQSPLTRCYKFGVALNTNTCYIEFPDDIDTLFGEGITITYIKTQGRTGSISAFRLNSFLNDVSSVRNHIIQQSSEDVTLTSNEVNIYNPFPILNGSDPETIDEAYKNYRRVKDTFDTLVSLKDYNNYMLSSKLASNGYVCDRTNDPQYSYKIREAQDLGSVDRLCQEPLGDDQETLSAFDLTVYALQYVENVDSDYAYKSTFTLVNNDKFEKSFENNDIKSMQHDFKGFQNDKILMIKNKYPIHAMIVPKYKVSPAESHEIIYNIEKALWGAINSKNIDFGEGAPYDLIYDTITEADSRIKAVSLDYPTYETYAVFWHGGRICELRVDDKLYTDTDKKTVKYRDKLSDTDHQLIQMFRAEIFAKNVLTGTTPLYDFEDSFVYGAHQEDPKLLEDVVSIKPNLTIEVPTSEASSIEIMSNESVLFTAPAYVEEGNYSSYVKIVHNISDTVNANSLYTLKPNEFIAFFYKETSTDTEYTYVKYDSSEESLGTHITPSFQLQLHNNFEVIVDGVDKLPVGKGKLTDGELNSKISDLSSTDLASLEVLTGTRKVTTYNINKVQINNDKNGCPYVYWILNSDEEEYSIPWNVNDGDTDSAKYVLRQGEYFLYTDAEKRAVHILGEGTLLECGATIYTDQLSTFTCKKNTYTNFLLEGVNSVEWVNIGVYNANKLDKALFATEQEQHLVGPNTTITFTPVGQTYESIDVSELLVASTASPHVFDDSFEISYTTANDTTVVLQPGNTWTMLPILNIDVSPDVPQKLSSRNNVRLQFDIETTQGSPASISDCSVLCSIPIKSVGDNSIVTKEFKESADVDICNILYYIPREAKTEDGTTDTSIVYDASGHIKLTFNGTVPVKETEIEVFPGTYLVQIVVEEGNVNAITNISVTSEVGTLLLSHLFSETTESSEVVNTLYTLTSIQGEQQTVPKGSLTVTTDGGSCIIAIHPFKKYTDTTLSNIVFKDIGGKYPVEDHNNDAYDSFEAHVRDMLKQLDRNSKCNYTDLSVATIKNPLEAKSFVEKTHAYNQYTIAEWDNTINDAELVVLTTVR